MGGPDKDQGCGARENLLLTMACSQHQKSSLVGSASGNILTTFNAFPIRAQCSLRGAFDARK